MFKEHSENKNYDNSEVCDFGMNDNMDENMDNYPIQFINDQPFLKLTRKEINLNEFFLQLGIKQNSLVSLGTDLLYQLHKYSKENFQEYFFYIELKSSLFQKSNLIEKFKQITKNENENISKINFKDDLALEYFVNISQMNDQDLMNNPNLISLMSISLNNRKNCSKI